MSGTNKKKMGYKQFEKLLALAHQKSEFLAEKIQELQSYFIAYIEYRGDNIEFNTWMNKRVEEIKIKAQNNEKKEEEHVHEKV